MKGDEETTTNSRLENNRELPAAQRLLQTLSLRCNEKERTGNNIYQDPSDESHRTAGTIHELSNNDTFTEQRGAEKNRNDGVIRSFSVIRFASLVSRVIIASALSRRDTYLQSLTCIAGILSVM